MKTLKKGKIEKKDSPIGMVVRCNKCKGEFRIEAHDAGKVKPVHHSPEFYYIPCKTEGCGEQIQFIFPEERFGH